jgi:hypothetical protein
MPGMLVPKEVNPPLAAVMSFFLPGLGQLYLGQTAKGILFLVLLIMGPFTGGISHLVLALYASIEAYKLSKRRCSGDPVSSWGTLWDPTWMPFS